MCNVNIQRCSEVKFQNVQLRSKDTLDNGCCAKLTSNFNVSVGLFLSDPRQHTKRFSLIFIILTSLRLKSCFTNIATHLTKICLVLPVVIVVFFISKAHTGIRYFS